jgi:hypothetical protein
MEVGKMPAERKTNQSRRLTAAGLVAVTAATLLMMGWAILPNAAFASGTFTWGGNGFPNAKCTPGQVQTMLWIFNDNGSAVPTGLTINGVAQAGSWQQQGGGTYHFTTSGAQFPPVEGATTFATYTGTLGTNTVLTLSGCNEGQTTTTTSTTSTTSTTTTTTHAFTDRPARAEAARRQRFGPRGIPSSTGRPGVRPWSEDAHPRLGHTNRACPGLRQRAARA